MSALNDEFEQATWLWTMEAQGRLGPDARRVLSRSLGYGVPTSRMLRPVIAVRDAGVEGSG